ncbi:hypothetical protein BWQ96_08974 [Gracilariopsis chorda]|uniref:Uncharacterized protein n=1 Tax=Gracilariopsis chorda TaxID=448386 RepID=A0A2V3IGV1_9FLOR|nr:hypothetical protein BWQ96_08974 [Gracilariopsis chorda]|eukprot:PXF41299.1 hypothetical protein BWQ96_08974 [Gracilariopsis chorda]
MDYNPSHVESSLDTRTSLTHSPDASHHELREHVQKEQVLLEANEHMQNALNANAVASETFRNASACKCIPATPLEINQARIQKQSCQQRHQRVLKRFDQDTTYGPCSGVTREERLHRAKHFRLDIAAEVEQALLRQEQWQSVLKDEAGASY